MLFKRGPPRQSMTIPLKTLLNWLASALIWVSVIVGCICLWFAYDLPDIDRLILFKRRAGITLLAKDNTLIGTYGDMHGSFIKSNQLPKHTLQAILSTEDRRFYHHFGIDVWGIIRAAYINYKAGRVVQGGSTLTQQLAKNLLMSEGLYTRQDRSMGRKVQEILLALLLEFKLDKNQILTIYLNRIYFGGGVFGIEAAALRYFQKSAVHLNLMESATLAGLLKAPSKYSPLYHLEQAQARANIVLQNMLEAGFITPYEKSKAIQSFNTLTRSQEKATMGRYFSDWVFEQLTNIVGDLTEDLIVYTTLDPLLQKTAEDMLEAIILFEGQRYKVQQGALVAMTPRGAIRAMVGGVDYNQSQFNRATQAKRQTGSVFKPFVFIGAFEQGLTPQNKIQDTPVTIGKWTPKNYKWQARGTVSIEAGLAYSLNTVTVRLAALQGWKSIHDVAKRLGVTTALAPNLSIALGSGEATLLEMTGAYGTIANHGFKTTPHGITRITTPQGKILYNHKVTPHRVIDPKVCSMMVQCLRAVLTYGTGRKSQLTRPAAGKSGTSQKHRDAWFIGFTPDLITGVWMGNDTETSMAQLTGGVLPGRLWHDFMEDIHKNKPKRSFFP